MATKDPKKAQYIRQQIKLWDDNWKINRDQYHLYTSFVMGEQWTEDESRVFENYRKIPMTRNKLAPLVMHLVGEQRQNTPNLQVEPSDDTPEQEAEVVEALVKDISLSSDAKVVYQIAFQQAAIGGFGCYFMDTAYLHEHSFDQDPVYMSVKDPTRCYWDMGAESPCKTDGMLCGKRTRVTRKKFAALYGKKLEKLIPTSNEENTFIAVADDDSITIIDHYEREYSQEKIYLLSNETVVTSKELAKIERLDIEGVEVLMVNGAPVTILDDRDTHHYTVKHTKWAGDYELEKRDFPSEQLPGVFVDQNSYYDKKGRQICRPFIKDAKDAQKYLNYLFTQSAYLLKISRYDQFLVSKANVKSNDTQGIWRDPSTVQGGLIYDESPNGNKPEQLHPPELSQSLQQQWEIACNDIESCTGMYKSQLGEQGNEISGKAIDSRTRRGSFTTFTPFDNLNRAISVGGEIVNEMRKHLYDTKRTMKLNMKNKGLTSVTLNNPVNEYSEEKENDMSKGRFKIRLVAGASYEGQKQENLDSFNQVLTADRSGQVFPLIADLYVENLPLANALEIKNRLRTIVPPEIIEAGKTGEPIPKKDPQPDPMLILKQQELQIKAMEAKMDAQNKMQEIALKQQELQMDAGQSQANSVLEFQKLEHQKTELMAHLAEMNAKIDAELKKAMLDAHSGHHKNIADLVMTGASLHTQSQQHKEKNHGTAQTYTKRG